MKSPIEWISEVCWIDLDYGYTCISSCATHYFEGVIWGFKDLRMEKIIVLILNVYNLDNNTIEIKIWCLFEVMYNREPGSLDKPQP